MAQRKHGVNPSKLNTLPFREERALFESQRERMLAEYEGKYVAIINGEVVDADDDFSKLAERVYRREGYRDIFMPRVQRRSTVISIPTPHIGAQRHRDV